MLGVVHIYFLPTRIISADWLHTSMSVEQELAKADQQT